MLANTIKERQGQDKTRLTNQYMNHSKRTDREENTCQ